MRRRQRQMCIRDRFATALGLLAAIPAVAAYNKFSGDMDKIGTSLDVFAQEFTTLLGRQLDEGGQ